MFCIPFLCVLLHAPYNVRMLAGYSVQESLHFHLVLRHTCSASYCCCCISYISPASIIWDKSGTAAVEPAQKNRALDTVLKKASRRVLQKVGGGRNFERRNVERLKFRNFKVTNIKITKDELFDSFIIEFIFSFFRYYLNTQNI